MLINWQHRKGRRSAPSQAPVFGLRQEMLARGTAGTATSCPRDGETRSPLLGEPPGMNTAASEQTEPEELKEDEGGRGQQRGRPGGRWHSLYPRPAQGSGPPPGPRGSAHRWGPLSPLPPQDSQELRQSNFRKSSSSAQSSRAPGFRGVGEHGAPVLIMRLPQTQGPRACRMLPPTAEPVRQDLGQAGSDGEAGRDGNRQGVRHGHPRAPALALAQKPPKAWPHVTPQ